MNTEPERNNETSSFISKNFIILLLFVFSIPISLYLFLFIFMVGVNFLRPVSGYIEHYSIMMYLNDIKIFLGDLGYPLYFATVILIWLTFAYYIEHFLNRKIDSVLRSTKEVIKYFALYFISFLILVNVSFVIIHFLVFYFPVDNSNSNSNGSNGFEGIEFAIFPFISFPFIAVFVLARYFLFISFEQGFFSNIFLRLIQKTKFMVTGILIIWTAVIISGSFKYLVLKNDMKINFQEQENFIKSETSHFCALVGEANKVFCYEEYQKSCKEVSNDKYYNSVTHQEF